VLLLLQISNLKAPITSNAEVFLKGFKIKTMTAHFPKSFCPTGYLIQCKDKSIYHAGVTTLLDTFSKIDVDVALLPMSSQIDPVGCYLTPP